MSKNTILIVDDEPGNLGVVSDFLKGEGFRISSANSGELAIRRAETVLPELILLDISMPGMGGIEACRELKKNERTCAIPVIFMTAHTETEDKVRGFKAGAVDYVTKPIQKEELLARVSIHLKLYQYNCSLEQDVEMKSREINESRLLLSDTVDTMPSVIIGITTEGIVNIWNEEAALFSSIPAEIAIGSELTDLISKLKLSLDSAVEAIYRGEECHIPKLYTAGIGKYEYARLSTYHLKNSPNEGAIIRIDDISEQYHMEDILHHSQKLQAIGELASGVAHDFNNQLAGILGSAELLSFDFEQGSDHHTVIQTIIDSVNRSSDLTRKLLSFARKGNQVCKSIPVLSLMREVVTLLDHSLKKDIKISLLGDDESLTILGDPSQLQNSLLNLGINACDAISGNGEVVYSLGKKVFSEHFQGLEPGNYLEIKVSDNGSGIPDEVLQNIYKPFFTTKAEGKGTGMGLASVMGTVQSHAGAITVDTSAGKGTTFRIYLPQVKSVPDQSETYDNLVRRERLRILCVDDEPVLLHLLELLLKRQGHEVVACTEGADAVEKFRNGVFDLVILDMIMPGLDGAAVFRKLQDIDPDVRAVIASGYTDSAISQSLFSVGVKAFLLKPYRLKELLKVLDIAFAGSAEESEKMSILELCR